MEKSTDIPTPLLITPTPNISLALKVREKWMWSVWCGGVSPFEPPPLVFIVVNQGASFGEITWDVQNCLQGSTKDRHLEARAERAQCQVGRPCGRPTYGHRLSPPILVSKLLERSLSRFLVIGLKIHRFTPSGGPSNPCADACRVLIGREGVVLD